MLRALLRRAVGCFGGIYANFSIITISITIDMVMVVGSGIDIESLWAYSLPRHLIMVTWRIGSWYRKGVHGTICGWCAFERGLHEVDIWLLMRYICHLRSTIKVRDLHFNIFSVRVHSLFCQLVEVLLPLELLL